MTEVLIFSYLLLIFYLFFISEIKKLSKSIDKLSEKVNKMQERKTINMGPKNTPFMS